MTKTAPVDAHQRARVAVPFLIVTLIWSSTWLVITTQLGTVPAAWSVTYRFAIAAVAMFAYARATGARLRFDARGHAIALVYGTAQYCLNYFAVYVAEANITSGLVAVIFAALVVPNALFAWAFLGQGVTRAFLMGSALAMIGMAVLFAHEVAAAPADHGRLIAGIGWSAAAVLIASAANVMQAAPSVRRLPLASLVAWGMAWGSVANIVFAWIVDGPPVFVASPVYWAGTLYLALLGSALAFTLYFHIVRTIGPARAAYTGVLTPALAMLLSTLFEHYRWSWEAALGGVLALAGLVVALRARAASPAR